jgi:hypothetical protein
VTALANGEAVTEPLFTSVRLALDAKNGLGSMTLRELWDLPAWFVAEVRFAFANLDPREDVAAAESEAD